MDTATSGAYGLSGAVRLVPHDPPTGEELQGLDPGCHVARAMVFGHAPRHQTFSRRRQYQ